MNCCVSIRPDRIKEEERLVVENEKYKTFTMAYVDRATYCWNLKVDNGIEFSASEDALYANLQIGGFNAIGDNLQIPFGRNHNTKAVSTAVSLFLKENHREQAEYKSTYNQKGMVIIQNDVWIGENVTIMPSVIVRNGAVIARNSHVVSDVPPYAVVGGNPARVIGHRYTEEQIKKMQTIQWWYWDKNKILENAEYFNEDIEGFCNRFYDKALLEYTGYAEKRQKKDIYFAFVDYYEEYCSFAHILESFLDEFCNQEKKLVLFVRTDCPVKEMAPIQLRNLQQIADEITSSPDILCSIEVVCGDLDKAKDYFVDCSHYIVSRTYGTVYFSCLADQLGIEMISGVDSVIPFEKRSNMIRKIGFSNV